MAAAFADQFALSSPTGATLNVFHQPASGRLRAIVHINHGLAEHAARYARFAHALGSAGFAVVAHDHRGHGQTTASDAPQGVFSNAGSGVDAVMADIAAVHAEIGRRHPDQPLFMFGHSMGGLITMNHALRHPGRLAGAAVWNANFSGGIAGRAAQAILAWERMRLGSDVPSRLLPRLTFGAWARAMPNRRTGFDWLSRIESEVDAYIAEPMCGWDASVGLWQDVFAMIFAGGRVRAANDQTKALPFHLVGGGQDPATENGKAVRRHAERMRQAGFADVTETIYPDARHETLNDRDAERATGDFIAWMETRL